MDKIREIFSYLDPLARMTMINKIDEIDALRPIQQKTTIKTSQIAVFLLIVILLFITSLFTKITTLFVWIICYFFPAYFTLTSLRDGRKQNYGKYLIYWIFYVTMCQIEPYLRILIDRTFFNIIKITCTVLILNDHFDAGNRFFEGVLKPLLQKQSVKSVTENIQNLIKKGKQKVENKLKGN